MNDLTISKHNGVNVIDSRDVAEMIGKQHRDLLESIRGYIKYLECGYFRSRDFFIEGSYINSQNKEQPCYFLTRKGCDMVANKMTGEKGVLFTAAYVTKFEEMEKQIQASIQQLSPQLQLLINMELEQKKLQEQIRLVTNTVMEAKEEAAEVKQEMQGIREIVTLNPNAWRADTTRLINVIAKKLGGFDHIKNVREESYKLLDERAGAKLGIRLTNKKRKVLEESGSKSKVDKVSKLDVIADDKRLTEVYIAIVKEMAIKYGAA